MTVRIPPPDDLALDASTTEGRGRNHPGSPYWLEVAGDVEELQRVIRGILNNRQRRPAWAKTALALNLTPIAQAGLIAQATRLPQPPDEEAVKRSSKLRRTALAFERELRATLKDRKPEDIRLPSDALNEALIDIVATYAQAMARRLGSRRRSRRRGSRGRQRRAPARPAFGAAQSRSLKLPPAG